MKVSKHLNESLFPFDLPDKIGHEVIGKSQTLSQPINEENTYDLRIFESKIHAGLP